MNSPNGTAQGSDLLSVLLLCSAIEFISNPVISPRHNQPSLGAICCLAFEAAECGLLSSDLPRLFAGSKGVKKMFQHVTSPTVPKVPGLFPYHRCSPQAISLESPHRRTGCCFASRLSGQGRAVCLPEPTAPAVGGGRNTAYVHAFSLWPDGARSALLR